MTEEEWKVIDGFDSDYMISNCGRVWSNKTQKILTPFLNESGYYKLTLRENGRNRGVLLHRLIALAFIPNPESKPTVNNFNAVAA